MAPRRYALILSLVALSPAVAWSQTLLTPQDGLLLLRNGHVLEGQITRAGDYFIVTQGESSEIRMRAEDVEALCGSLEEAYEFKARHVSGRGIAPQLDLAEWCLRHNLYAKCAEQLISAMQIAPQDERLLLLERRLNLAVQGVPTLPASTPASTVGATSNEIERTIRDLPPESVEKFTTVVQPILLNRCSAGSCHGPGSPSNFRLQRPLAGQVANQRFTHRNLYAALQHVNHSDPDASPLLSMPQQKHGTAPAAVFNERSQDQLNALKQWVRLAIAPSVKTAPVAPSEAPTTLLQAPLPATEPPKAVPAMLPPGAVENARPVADAAANGGVGPPSAAEETKNVAEASHEQAADRFVPRDRYDAEIFNRRYGGR